MVLGGEGFHSYGVQEQEKELGVTEVRGQRRGYLWGAVTGRGHGEHEGLSGVLGY